ncbi:MAG: hypothetical protein ACRC6Z_07635 [Cetobacterium sp.]
MVINERCIKILSDLSSTNSFTLKKLSENFNVHTRTIRYDIDNINYILKNHKLSQIEKSDDGKLLLNISSNELNKIITDFGGVFSENRKIYLKLKFFSKELVNLTKEAQFLNVSRTTIKKDLMIIKNEMAVKNILLKEVTIKGIKIVGSTKDIVEAFEEELQKIMNKQFINLPNVLKDLFGKIVGDVTPDILKARMKDILKSKYKTVYYNKIFCKLAALNIRNKLNINKVGYNSDEVNTFIFCSKGEEFILKTLSEEIENKKEADLKKIHKVLKDFMAELEIPNEQKELDKLLTEIGDTKIMLPISEKICETNFYKEFYKRIVDTKLNEEEIKSIFYILYNRIILIESNIFKKLKILFVSDDLEVIKDIIEIKLHNIFKFKEISKITSHMFEIFGCEKEYDLIITSKNIKETLETIVYKINNFPLESDFVDLKFFILNSIKL